MINSADFTYFSTYELYRQFASGLFRSGNDRAVRQGVRQFVCPNIAIDITGGEFLMVPNKICSRNKD